MEIIETNPNIPRMPTIMKSSDEEWMEYYWSAYQQQKCKTCGMGPHYYRNYQRYKALVEAKQKNENSNPIQPLS